MPTSSDISKLVERQVRNWELARAQRVELPTAAAAKDVEQFVTVSRTFGSGGAQVAALLGERLGWPVFDKEILQTMAGDDKLRERLYTAMDERDRTWIGHMLNWLLGGEFRRDDYYHRLSEAVLAIARQGRAVFLGRGADTILPKDRGLRVRIVAPLEQRARVVAERLGLELDAARAEAEAIDRERDEFVRNHSDTEAGDPTRNDLCINMAGFTPARAADVIVATLRIRGIIV